MRKKSTKTNALCPGKEFYGTATIGERGQIVIPADARRDLNLKSGDKMLVFGIGGAVACAKFEDIEKIASEMAVKLDGLKSLIKKT